MEYNTSRTHLHMPEYGRIIQILVEHCKTLPSKEERNTMANAIITFMGQRNPQLRDEEDYKHKLWEHLNILADFQLDVDAPYNLKTAEELAEKPAKMAYPALQGEYKFYGKSILQLIELAIHKEDGEEKTALIEVIANTMKKSYSIYHKDNVEDQVIFRHLRELSQDRLDISGIVTLEKSKVFHHHNKNKNHKGGKNNHSKHHRYQSNKNRRK